MGSLAVDEEATLGRKLRVVERGETKGQFPDAAGAQGDGVLAGADCLDKLGQLVFAADHVGSGRRGAHWFPGDWKGEFRIITEDRVESRPEV